MEIWVELWIVIQVRVEKKVGFAETSTKFLTPGKNDRNDRNGQIIAGLLGTANQQHKNIKLEKETALARIMDEPAPGYDKKKKGPGSSAGFMSRSKSAEGGHFKKRSNKHPRDHLISTEDRML